MVNIRRITHAFGLLLLLSLATENYLSAYTDPGSGAMVVQVLLAGIIGGLFKIRSFFTRSRRRGNI